MINQIYYLIRSLHNLYTVDRIIKNKFSQMANKEVFLCNSCGNDFPKWSGQCPVCKEWNTIKEFKTSKEKQFVSGEKQELISISSVNTEKKRISTAFLEFDRVLGGGLLSDSLTLLTGDPGVGKSTLSLQAAIEISSTNHVLYVSGEESEAQIASRAQRISDKKLDKFNLLSESNLENVIKTIAHKPELNLVVIDSIQTMYSSAISALAGSPTQVKYCAESLMHFFKQKNLACLLIGHVTKDGNFSGPQTLAHLVDTVLYLEGERYNDLRILRSTKNRFGSTSEIGVFSMNESGLVEIKNPSSVFLDGRLENAEGSVIFPSLEGTRPLLVEVQALSTWTNFGHPKRTASGVDINRLHIMLAVLQKHAGVKMDNMDVFVNVVGGLRVNDPALDLALVMAIYSSKTKKSLGSDIVCMGELGLSGEIRSVQNIEKRLKEAEKLGFKVAVLPKLKQKISTKLELKEVNSLTDALKIF